MKTNLRLFLSFVIGYGLFGPAMLGFAQGVFFSGPTNFGVGDGPVSIAIGDFNGDGKRDLVVSNLFSNNVSILLGNGDGSFGSATNLAVGTYLYSVAVGEFQWRWQA